MGLFGDICFHFSWVNRSEIVFTLANISTQFSKVDAPFSLPPSMHENSKDSCHLPAFGIVSLLFGIISVDV